ncbi:hypothetical protein [Nonomuraea sp. NPDC049709]|uniref:hypothetical protein n=1 Tax=Nonomuraea sp. NPDC049709 TaxID=3154736 RepID=UPI00343DB2A7
MDVPVIVQRRGLQRGGDEAARPRPLPVGKTTTGAQADSPLQVQAGLTMVNTVSARRIAVHNGPPRFRPTALPGA